MTTFWSVFIIILVVGNIIGMMRLLFATSRKHPDDNKDELATTGHVWDGDLTEWNNPLPRWWFYLFIITTIFGVVYMALYPGLGSFQGILGWSQMSQYEENMKSNLERQEQTFSEFRDMPVEELASQAQAMRVAKGLFANYCATCHGANARGGKSFPNLVDEDWLYGKAPEQIKATIMHGRNGAMPNLGLSRKESYELTHYVISLSRETPDPIAAARGKILYQSKCVACHGVDGKGNQALGAPNLTDDIWLHGRSTREIQNVLLQGVSNIMPAHSSILNEDEIHFLTAYVLSISGNWKTSTE